MAQSTNIVTEGTQNRGESFKSVTLSAGGLKTPVDTFSCGRQQPVSKPRESTGPCRGGFGDRSGR